MSYRIKFDNREFTTIESYVQYVVKLSSALAIAKLLHQAEKEGRWSSNEYYTQGREILEMIVEMYHDEPVVKAFLDVREASGAECTAGEIVSYIAEQLQNRLALKSIEIGKIVEDEE